LTAALALVVAIPVVALAAWNPDEDEVEDYTDAVAAVRDDIADWLEDDDLERTTKVVLKIADRQLRRAENRFGEEPGARKVLRSLEALEDAVFALRIVRKIDRDSDLRDFIDEASEALYDESEALVLSATLYVMGEHDSEKAARRLLRAGAKATKAKQKAKDGRFRRGILLNAKAILVLARGNLL
jgi:hypothetical protein